MSKAPGPRGPHVRAAEVLARLTTTNPVGVEVGVWRGQMSEELLRQCPGLRLVMVDPWEGVQQPRTSRSQSALILETARRVAFAHSRYRIVRLASVEAARMLSEVPYFEPFDFAFIDADHRYEAVVADIEAWTPKIREGGLLCGHDYFPAHTTERNYGVVQAVDEAVTRNGWRLELGRDSTWFVRL